MLENVTSWMKSHAMHVVIGVFVIVVALVVAVLAVSGVFAPDYETPNMAMAQASSKKLEDGDAEKEDPTEEKDSEENIGEADGEASEGDPAASAETTDYFADEGGYSSYTAPSTGWTASGDGGSEGSGEDAWTPPAESTDGSESSSVDDDSAVDEPPYEPPIEEPSVEDPVAPDQSTDAPAAESDNLA